MLEVPPAGEDHRHAQPVADGGCGCGPSGRSRIERVIEVGGVDPQRPGAFEAREGVQQRHRVRAAGEGDEDRAGLRDPRVGAEEPLEDGLELHAVGMVAVGGIEPPT